MNSPGTNLPEPAISHPVRPAHPSELAERLQRLDADEAANVLRWLPIHELSLVLLKMDEALAARAMATIPADELASILEKLPHNVTAGLLAELPETMRERLLSQIDALASSAIKILLRYPENSVGRLMSSRFIMLKEKSTIGECLDMLQRRRESELDEISYLYVVDPEDRLAGILSVRDLIFRPSDRMIGSLMTRDVARLHVDEDRESMIRQFSELGFMALPVVDAENRLVGTVTSNQVIDVIEEEVTEDMQLMAGLSGEEHVYTPWRTSIGRRLSWLCFNLLTAFLAASVVSLFEGTIARWTALAIFLPVIVSQGSNSGIQTLTIIIRGMAMGELPPGAGRSVLTKELTLALLNGLAIGLTVALIGWLWQNDARLGIVAGSAVMLNMLAAALSGVLVPYALKAARIDPAMASCIFLTTITDVVGLFFFLGIATLAIMCFA